MIYRKNFLSLLFILSLMLLASASSWAETIKLKNGRVFDGAIADDRDGEIKVLMKSGVVTFSRSEIYSIDGKLLSPPKAVKKPAAKTTSVKSTAVAPKPVTKKVQKVAAPVKKKAAPKKPVAPVPAPAPVVAVDTTTVTVVVSTDTAPVPQSGSSISLFAVIFAILVIVIIAAVIMVIVKRIKNRSS